MKTAQFIILFALFPISEAKSAITYNFGDNPIQYIEAAASKYQHTCGLTKNELKAYFLAPTWGESAGLLPNGQRWAAPSPMTLGRLDTGNRLIPPERSESGAAWHPGVGTWQLDDFGEGSSAKPDQERFDSLAATTLVAKNMVARFKTAGCKPTNVFSPWGASCGNNYSLCFTRYDTVLKLLNSGAAYPTESVDRFGGSELHQCRLAGQTFSCLYVNPASAQPKGETGNWSALLPGAPLKLARPFYVFHLTDTVNTVTYEWRFWLAADTLNGHDIAARRADGQNSRSNLCWISAAQGELSSLPNCQLPASSLGLCDLGRVGPSGLPVGPQRGACSDPSNLSVTLTAMPNGGAVPLNSVTLTANVIGAPNETINYTFYCNRSDAGTNITPNWDKKYDGLLRTQVKVPGLCNYPSVGTYIAKIIAEQGDGAVESRVPITVGNSITCFPLTLAANNPARGTAPSAAPLASPPCALGGYIAGSEIQLTAAPANGWTVGSWAGTQNDASTSATNSLVMPAAIHTVAVNYVQSAPSPLTILTTTLADAAPNQSYSAQLLASGGTGIGYLWSLQAGSLPAGLTLTTQTGLISGTPTQSGTLSDFTVGVRDSGGNSTSRRFSFYVRQTPGPSIISNASSNFAFYVGAPYTQPNSITYLALGGQAPYSWQASGLPPGLQIDAAGGFLFGTPTQPGDFTAQITVSDSLGQTASVSPVLRVITGTLIITDSSGHTPPNPPAGTVGVNYTTVFAAQVGSNSGYGWSVQGSLPPGLMSQNGPGCPANCALFVVGTPTQTGTFSFTVVVRDSLGNTASQGATIIINSGHPPTINTAKLPKATIGSAYSVPLAASGGTPGYQWAFVGPSPDPGIQLSLSGVLSGTPTLTNDCPTGATDGPGIWVGPNYPTRYFSVRVTDAAGQSATMNLCLVSYYPTPQLTDTNPPSVLVDGQNHTITVHGTNLRSTSMLEIGSNAPSAITYVSPTTVAFNLYPASGGFSTSPGGGGFGEATYPLQVIQPYAAFSTSSINFSIFDPPPTVSAVSAVINNTSQPCRANLSCELVVSGAGLVYSTSYLVVESNQSLGRDVSPSTAIPWTQVTVGVFSVPTAGTYTLRVTNVSQPNGQPASVDTHFTVQP